MKRNYSQPATTVAEVLMTTQLLAGSPAGPAPAPGVNGVRSGYVTEGGGSEITWE